MREVTTRRTGIVAVTAVGIVVAACSTASTDPDTSGTSTSAPTEPLANIAVVTSEATPTEATDLLDGPVDAVLTNLGDARIAAFGGVDCAEEAVLLLVAIDRFETTTGRTADEFGAVEAALGGPLDLWSWDGGAAIPRPRPGSGCSSAGFEPTEERASDADDASTICGIERRTLETAVETFRAVNPTAHAPTEDELVGSLLQEPSERWDLDGWDVVPAPGSICEPHRASSS